MIVPQFAKNAVRSSPLWPYIVAYRATQTITEWKRSGSPLPPPHAVKVRNILELAERYGTDTFIETGTFCGDMIEATRRRFRSIASVEVDPGLARAAVTRFRSFPHIQIFEGDSAFLLPSIVSQLRGPALFWLDGHYSGPGTGRGAELTPVVAELETIARQRRGEGDVIVIDDARLFGRDEGYPPLGEFITMIEALFGVWPEVSDDAIRILP